MMLQPAIWAEHHVGVDYTIRSDDSPHADFSSRIDNRRRMNLHVAHLCEPSPQSSPLCQGERRKSCRLPRRVFSIGALFGASPFIRERVGVRVDSAHLSRNVNISSASE